MIRPEIAVVVIHRDSVLCRREFWAKKYFERAPQQKKQSWLTIEKSHTAEKTPHTDNPIKTDGNQTTIKGIGSIKRTGCSPRQSSSW